VSGRATPVKLSVVIPCYNEIETIGRVIEAVRAALPADKEIIVVDDGSTDGSTERLEGDLRARIDVLIQHAGNQGKGAALRSGFQAASGDVVVVQDADLEYNPHDYPLLLAPIVEGHADVVYGSRFMGAAPHRVLYFWHRLGNGLLTLLSNMFTDLNLSDMETGYKAFRREVVQSIRIEENRFGFEPEITAKVARGGWRVYEVGISYFGRTYAEGKKITYKDGLHSIWCIVRYNVFR
jgi:glycosyltransferase involved in cell wall biosynthesis